MMRLLAEYSPMIDKPFSVGVILGIFTTGGDKLLQLLEELPVIKNNNNNHTLLSPAAILTETILYVGRIIFFIHVIVDFPETDNQTCAP